MVDTNSLIALIIAIPGLIGAAVGTIAGVFNFIGHHANRKDITDINTQVQANATKIETALKKVEAHDTQIADAIKVGAELTGTTKVIDEHATDIDNLQKQLVDVTAKLSALQKDIPK